MNILRPLAIVSLLMTPCLAMAASPWCKGTARTTTWTPPRNIAMQRDAPDGTLLHSTGWMDNGQATANCTGDSPLMIYRGYSADMKSTQFSKVYETGVPGIGIKVGYHNSYSNTPSSIDSSSLMERPMYSYPAVPTTYTPAQRFWVQLIKTGPLGSGTFSVPSVQVFYENMLTNTLSFQTTTINTVNRGCFVQSGQSQDVNLPNVDQKTFTSVGSTVGAKSFNITLECDPNTKISYQIDGLTVAGNVLAADPAVNSPATGVGVQLFRGDASSTTVQPLASKTAFLTTPNLLTTVNSPLTARYYQTASKVTPGNVRAGATVTLFYE